VYGWVWRHLPGPLAARAATAFLLVVGVVAVLFFVVFPTVEPHLPTSHVTVHQPSAPR
jgi:hypothetical protein